MDPKLTPEHQYWAALAFKIRTLQTADGWDAYAAQLLVREEELKEELLKVPPEGHDFTRGMILGIRWARKYPETLVSATKQ